MTLHCNIYSLLETCQIFRFRSVIHQKSGLGIRSLVFRANRSFFERERAIVRCALFKLWITLIPLFAKSDKSKSLMSIFSSELRERMSSFTKSKRWIYSFVLEIKSGKAWWKEWVWRESLVKRANCSRHSLLKDIILSLCPLSKERPERFAPVPIF